MNIVPRRSQNLWDPFRELERFQRDIDQLLDFSTPVLARNRGNGTAHLSPAVDIRETEKEVVVKVDIPGVDKKDLDINVTGDVLTIKGEKKEEKDIKEKGLVRSERYYGSFHRMIELPAEVDSSKVNAQYKDGVLEIALPKKEDAKPKQQRIEVK